MDANTLARVIRAIRIDRTTGAIPYDRPLKKEAMARTGLSDKAYNNLLSEARRKGLIS